MNKLADVTSVTMRHRSHRVTYRDGAFGRILAAGYDRLKDFNTLPAQYEKRAVIDWISESLTKEEVGRDDDRNAGKRAECPHCQADLEGLEHRDIHKCPVPTTATGGHTKVGYAWTAAGEVEVHQPVNEIIEER